MNPKDYSKKRINGYVVASEKMPSISYMKPLKSLVQKNPKTTIPAMLIFATLNFVLMVYVVNSRPAAPLIPKYIGKKTDAQNSHHNNDTEASFSFSNYMKISK